MKQYRHPSFEEREVPSRGLRGFTVLEVMVALTIFALVSVAVFAIFRAAFRSERVGQRETRMLQKARFALDTFERDVTNIFFRDETAYNVNISHQIERMERERLEAEDTGDWEGFYNNWGNPDDQESADGAQFGNPYERGRIVDMQMTGSNNGDNDTLTFAVDARLDMGKPYRPYGLARVKYFVDSGWLVRSENDVESIPRDQFGNLMRMPEPPQFTRLADGVQKFNLNYTFWYDNQWYEVPTWNSSNRLIRNPRHVLGDYREDEERDWGIREENSAARPLRPGDPGWNEYVNDQQSEPLDRLPSAIRVRLELADPDDPKRTQVFERIIRVPPAEETYEPRGFLTEDEREEERDLRDQQYRMIFPGAMDKF